MKPPFKQSNRPSQPHRDDRKQGGSVTLARALSKLGVASRSQAAILITEGKVTVNGKVVLDPNRWCSMERDRIEVKGASVSESKKQLTYLILNKPAGYVTTRSDERGNKTVYDLLGDLGSWVYPVGRLDKDTSGLLLFTNDHQLGERLTNPNSKVPKTYRVELNNPLDRNYQQQMELGIDLDGTQLLPASFEFTPGEPRTIFELSITEGKNRQIRRMMEQYGYTVVSLVRLSIGLLELGDLEPGKWRHLTPSEIKQLPKPSR